MTKKERAKRLQAIQIELLMPEPGNGQLFVDVQATSANDLHAGILHKKGPGDQIFIQVHIIKPDAVQTLFEAMTGPEEREP